MPQTLEFDLVTAFNETSLNISAAAFSNSNPNDFYEGADIAWMMMSSALVLLMVPGLGLFYAGVSERCSALSMMWFSMETTALIGVQWYIWGYSIAFSGTNTFWGNGDSVVFHTDLTIPWGNKPGTKIPQLLYALYQGMFASFTAAIVSGAVIRKGRPLHFLVFILFWSTFVYDPIARSTWNAIGWSNYWKGDSSGVFDFAGGTVVHISSASAAAIYSIFCSKWRRQIFRHFLQPLLPEAEALLNRPSKPHNVISVVLGTALLWIGWFGFNGGSALGANLRAVSACLSTHLAACAGGITGTLLEYIAAFRKPVRPTDSSDRGKFSVIGFCNGAVAGLVAVTPAAGYIPYWSAPIFGIAGSFFVALFQDWSDTFFDNNDVFVIHGVAGWVGMLLTAAFARADIAALDGYTVIVNHKWEQLGIQVSDAMWGMCWSALLTFIILLFMEAIIVSYRKIFNRPEEGFKLILDRDVLIDQEIVDEGGMIIADAGLDVRGREDWVELRNLEEQHQTGEMQTKVQEMDNMSRGHNSGRGVSLESGRSSDAQS